MEYPSCVVVDETLVGFFSMPLTPFVWLGFRNNKVNEPLDGFDGMTGYQGAYYQRMFHRIVTPPERKFSSLQDIGSQKIISEELLTLFDKYGVVFAADVSHCLTYETGLSAASPDWLRNFRMLDVSDVRHVWRGFIRLMDVWLDTHARSTDIKPGSTEVALFRNLLLQFVDVVPKTYLPDLGWDANRVLMMKHMFTPPELRARVPATVLESRDSLLKQYGGYRHFW